MFRGKPDTRRVFTREAVAAVLTHDFLARHDKKWPLVLEAELFALSDAIQKDPFRWDSNIKVCGRKGARELKRDFVDTLLKTFPLLSVVLEAGGDHVIVAGGSLVTALSGVGRRSSDADFFFVGQTVEEARSLLERLVAMIVALDPERSKVYLSRNAVSVSVSSARPGRYGREVRVYQFILRNYASVSHVLGGFDISCCGVGWSPKTGLVATPLAALSLAMGCVFVDVSRRSPSFEMRLLKYAEDKGMDVVFPGAIAEKVLYLEAGYKVIVFDKHSAQLSVAAHAAHRKCTIEQVVTSGTDVLCDYGTSDYDLVVLQHRNIAMGCAGREDGYVLTCESLTDRSTYQGHQKGFFQSALFSVSLNSCRGQGNGRGDVAPGPHDEATLLRRGDAVALCPVVRTSI
jgi:hypothetical protein